MKSDAVKRLFNQPNIIIKTIPLANPPNSNSSNTNGFSDKRNGIYNDFQNPFEPDISIHAVKANSIDKIDDSTLLPSKNEGKSEIALVPIKRKVKNCNHSEPCENIICDVNVQQYVDQNGVSPMLATDIDEYDANAPVSKHCKNVKCDALSIEHDRCRRALIKLHRVDRRGCCDICGLRLKYNKSRIYHKNCKRKNEYRHNENDGAQVLREKLREREIQLLEAAKLKKNDYMDPVTGYSKALEALQNNDELIVIPKTTTTPQQAPIITITTVPNNQGNQQFPNMKDVFGSILPNIPIMLSQSNLVIGKQIAEERSSPPPLQPILSPPPLRPITSTENASNTGGTLAQMLQNPFIKVTGIPQGSFVQPMSINDWLMTQQVVTTPIQPKPFLTPIRVVPIANLKTQPSLLHQTQGIPRFCIMADTGIRAPTPAQTQQHQQHQQQLHQQQQQQQHQQKQHQPNIIKLRPVQPIAKIQNNSIQESRAAKSKIWKKNARLRKKRAGRMFNCTYCPKRFSTDWYFKMHVARHRGEMLFSCKLCEEPFSNKYDIKKHVAKEHKEGEVRCEVCGLICSSETELQKHMKMLTHLKCEECKQSFKTCHTFNEHQKKHGSVVCVQCRIQVPKLRYKKHLLVQHGMSMTKVDNECTKMRCPIDCDFANETGEKKMNGIKQEINFDENDSISDQISIQDEMAFVKEESNGIDSEDGDDSDDEGALEINEDGEETEIDEEDIKLELPRGSYECPGCGEDFETEDELSEHNNICLRAALKLCKFLWILFFFI